jgi:Domain of unknown function (DUF4265)
MSEAGSDEVDQTLIVIAADRRPDGSVYEETLWVEGLPNGRYRLVRSPIIAQGIAAGDEFEVDPVNKAFRVVRRGGNVTVQLFITPELTRDVFDQLIGIVYHQLGGDLDVHTKTAAAFHVPVSIGFPAIEKVFDHFFADRSDAEWLFGNVYGADGLPLNWW